MLVQRSIESTRLALVLIAVVVSIMWVEEIWNLASRYSDYLGEVLLIFIISLYVIRHMLYRQRKNVVFVRDDTNTCTPSELVVGKRDPDTRLYTDCAVLSANIYEPSKEERISTDWTEIDLPIPGVGNVQSSKLAIEIWEYNEEKLIAIVFRGTVSGLNSWIANGHWLMKWLPIKDQYDQIKTIVPQIVSQLREKIEDGYLIIATGHSLGGGLAQHACYLHPEIQKAYVFNSSPVTGWTDFPKQEREGNVKNCKIYRLYERGEVLQYLRFFIKVGYLFNPAPNGDPYFVEHRVNLMKMGIVTSHGIRPLAYGLKKLLDEETYTEAVLSK